MHRQFRVEALSAHPNLVDVLAEWLVVEFGDMYHHAIWNLEIARQELTAMATEIGGDDAESSASGAATVPDRTWVALESDELVGSISLLGTDDVAGFGHLTPWLANVYVRPDVRRQGLGRRLVDVGVRSARESGHDAIHLVTSNRVDFYRAQGWSVVATGALNGHPATVMERSTAHHDDSPSRPHIRPS